MAQSRNGPEELRIRKACNEDVGFLNDLAFRAKASHGYDDAFMAACRQEIAVQPATLIEREVWVAEASNGCIVGFFGLWPPENGKSEVDPVYVEPLFHGRGIGSALWRQLERQAKLAGARSVRLDSDPHAVEFYRRMGCSVIGQSPSGSIRGRLLPRMEKSIL